MPVAFFKGWYTPELMELNPDVVFVFGDNARRVGKGGQAIIRDYRNSLGIATKRIGDMAHGSFFVEGDPSDRVIVEADLAKLEAVLKEGKKVVIPWSRQEEAISLGLERAQLTRRAPSLYTLICETIYRLRDEYGEWDIGKPAH